MDILFTTIRDILNGLIPTGALIESDVASLNEWLSYIIVIAFVYSIFVKPVFYLISPKKRG